MAEFTRIPERFFFTGLSTLPADALPPGKLPYATNMRSYVEGSISPRFGLTARSTGTFAGAVHTLARLNDSTPYNGGVSAVRLVGAGTVLYRGAASDTTYASIDTGYSGNPLTALYAQPPNSPRPYAYVADSLRMRKCATDGTVLQNGIAQPTAPSSAPTATTARLKLASSGDLMSTTAWIAAGDSASAPANVARINTVISQILFDSGLTGNCSIVPASLLDLTIGTVVTVGTGGGIENVVITDMTIAVASTTVGAIIYDSGSTGLCTIQPAGSLGTGQLDSPPIQPYRERMKRSVKVGSGSPHSQAPASVSYETVEAPAPKGLRGVPEIAPDPAKPSRRIRQVDFPVNSLVLLNGAETVRILSVAVGEDGIQSFRCLTATTIAAGNTIAGVAAFRTHLNTNRVPGELLTNGALENELTYPELPEDTSETLTRMTAGIQGAAAGAFNFAQFLDGTAVLSEDEVHLAIKVDRLTEVRSVRLYLDVDAASNDFLHNYLFFEWRANDIVSAIQATNASNVTPIVDARRTVVTNEQLERVFAKKSFVKKANKAADALAETAIAQQLKLGNNQWVDLRCKVRELIRVGTDPSRTLADVKRIEILLAAETLGAIDGTPLEGILPLTVQYDDLWVGGGGGLDVGDVGDPVVFTYRYRSSLTGVVSNSAPPSRGGVIPRRQNVDLVPAISSDAQVDRIDWFRLGGGLSEWTYVGTGSNSASAYTDAATDSSVVGGERLTFDNFQPWPVLDKPRTGTCNVAGTAVSRVSGDTFNTSWAPGSAIVVNGKATTIYAVASTGLLHLTDNVGSGSAVAFMLPNPTILSQPMGQFFGDYQGTYFGCGDPLNPGTLYWTKANNPETASDANNLLVTPPSEQLQCGFVYNTYAGVFSTQDLYQLLRDQSGGYRAIKTPCGRGSWTAWSFCMSPQGIIFLAEDGLFITAGGNPAVAIHPPDLRTIFPKDGLPGVSVDGIEAPDMEQDTKLRVSYIAGFVYFDYTGLDNEGHTLIFELGTDRFFYDESDLTALRVRLEEPGDVVYNQIIGGEDGKLYQYDADALSDAGTDIAWEVWTRWADGGSPRIIKQFGDVVLDLNAHGNSDGVSVVVVSDDASALQAAQVVGADGTARYPYISDLGAGELLARNIGLRISGTMNDAASPGEGVSRPELFLWESTFIAKADNTFRRASDWTDAGYQGAKFVQGVLIRANTYGVDKQIEIQRDGGFVERTLTINHEGEVVKAYPQAITGDPGWPPFVAHLVRVAGLGSIDWQFLGATWVYEPHPELATQMETQFTTHDLPGYLEVRDAVIAHESICPIRLRVIYNQGDTDDYWIEASGGVYKRDYVVLAGKKGIAVQYQLRSARPFRIYKKDCSVRVYGWGSTSPYLQTMPFGGPHRADGAAI